MLDETGITSMEVSKPVLSLTRLADSANQGTASDSKLRKSSTQSSPSRTASGPTSSPLSLRSLPPEPNRSIGNCMSVPLTVRGCIGEWAMPDRPIPAAAAIAAPVPAPQEGEAQRPWWPSVAKITTLAWMGVTIPV